MSVCLRLCAGMIAMASLAGAAAAAHSPVTEPHRSAAAPAANAFAVAARQSPVRLAQVDDTAFRLGQLEERIRVLNGRIEELNFQLLEMQERMRQIQEDNEFRFQELEGNRGDVDDAALSADSDVAAAGDVPTGETGTLGIITFDQSGELSPPPDSGSGDTQVASLPEDDPDTLYRTSYDHLLAGDYALAEIGFQNYVDTYPDARLISDAHFWLGESQYAQGEYHDAATTMLAAHKLFPNAPKSPEMLLKLGMSLAALDNRDTACATYREVLIRYPQASDVVRNSVAVEQSRMRC